MTRYLISIADGAMDVSEEELPDVADAEEALRWAARIAVACRCAQEVRELMFDPEV
jgi:hypothetical protein